MDKIEQLKKLEEDMLKIKMEIQMEESQKKMIAEQAAMNQMFQNSQIPPPPIYMNQQIPQQPTQIFQTITKKTAAVELINRYETTKFFLIGGIASPLLIMLANTFGMVYAAIISFAAIVPTAIYLNKVLSEIKRLKKEYMV